MIVKAGDLVVLTRPVNFHTVGADPNTTKLINLQQNMTCLLCNVSVRRLRGQEFDVYDTFDTDTYQQYELDTNVRFTLYVSTSEYSGCVDAFHDEFEILES